MAEKDLWKKAYLKQFGTEADDDMKENKDDVEEWRIKWESGYDAGEEWATTMVEDTAA